MLQVNRVNKRYGPNIVLQDVTFTLADGEHAALAGVNGSGKSTLLEIIAGKTQPDSGSVITGGADILGWLPQNPREIAANTIGESFALSLSGQYREGSGSLNLREAAQAERILAGLGLDYLPLDTRLEQLSGGELTRVTLAGLLLLRPDVLLLDEPTNHLDIPALEWLEGYLNTYPGSVLLISHDRVFLDRTISVIFELDELSHAISRYPGSYSAYSALKAAEKEKAYARWKDQQTEIRRLKADWVNTAEQARWSEQSTRDSTLRRYAKKVAKKGTAKKKRLERYLESPERVEKPLDRWRLRVNFEEQGHKSDLILEARDLAMAYPGREIFRDLDLDIRQNQRIALIGANGSGKSTLLKVLIGELTPQSGTVRWGESVRVGYMPQLQDDLNPELSALEVIQAIQPMERSEAYHFLHYFLFDEDHVTLPAKNLSYGQRARLRLARIVASGVNFLVLDEPINHLDVPSREQFELALQNYTGGLLLVAHDRAFISKVAETTWRLEAGRIQPGYTADLLLNKMD